MNGQSLNEVLAEHDDGFPFDEPHRAHVADAIRAWLTEQPIRRAITAYVCNVSNLPEPLQVPALGLDMKPLVDGLVDAVAAVLTEETP